VAQDYIEKDATYLVLSTKGVAEFGDDGDIDGSAEHVQKWMNDLLSDSGAFVTPGSSESGAYDFKKYNIEK